MAAYLANTFRGIHHLAVIKVCKAVALTDEIVTGLASGAHVFTWTLQAIWLALIATAVRSQIIAIDAQRTGDGIGCRLTVQHSGCQTTWSWKVKTWKTGCACRNRGWTGSTRRNRTGSADANIKVVAHLAKCACTDISNNCSVCQDASCKRTWLAEHSSVDGVSIVAW